MKIFVSWAGEYSKGVAHVLREYLPTMLQGLNVFMSQHDIDSGSRWAQRISVELEGSNFGLLCLTPNNLESKWLLFEAGALTKHIDGKACGLLCGGLTPKEVDGPLSQFQHRVLDFENFKILLHDLNKCVPQSLEKSQIDKIHLKWWPDIESEVAKLPSEQPRSTPRRGREIPEILEELVERVRGLERAQNSGSGPVVHDRGYWLATQVRSPAELELLANVVRGPRNLEDKGLRAAIDPVEIERLVDVGAIRRTNGRLRIPVSLRVVLLRLFPQKTK